jgi:hypothetical protein
LALLLILPAAAALADLDPSELRVSVPLAPPPEGPHGVPGAATAALFEGEVRVTSTPQWQNEPALAVNPLNPDNLIAGSNDYHYHGNGGFVWVGLYTSHDGGDSWSEQPLPGTGGLTNPVGGVLPYPSAGDPIMAFDGLGTAYAGGIDFQGGQSWIFVSASPDGGDTWLQPTFPGGALSGFGFQDKPDMAGDPTLPLAHVCWTDFGLPAIVAAAGAAGAWTPIVPISEVGPVQGCSIAVGGDSSVYVAYMRYSGCLSCGGSLKFTKAAPGGVGWSTPSTIVATQSVSGANFRINGFPSLAVDESGGASDGDLYVVWTDNRAGSADVWLVKSTDAGATWSAPTRVNQDPGTAGQFQAAVAVGPDGKVHVTFYDTRLGGGYTYWGATSEDGGATWRERPMASAPTPPTASAGFLGDYTDLQVGSDGVAHAVWADGRTGDQDLWVRNFG